jgi:serine/threonine protein kinase
MPPPKTIDVPHNHTNDEKIALQEKIINQILQPILQDIINFGQKLKHCGYWISTDREVRALPFGLRFKHPYFKKLPYTVIVGYDGKITILTGIQTRCIRGFPIQELIHPAEVFQNKIDNYLGKLSARRPISQVAKFPIDARNQTSALDNIKEIIDPILKLLQMLANASPWGTRFSRRRYSKLPYSLYLSRKGDIYVSTKIKIAAGAYKKVTRIISLLNENNYIISIPLDTEVNFFHELSRELRFYDRLKGQKGFLQYEEFYIQDSCGLGKPRGLIAEEYPFDGNTFTNNYLSTLDAKTQIQLKYRFICNLLDAIKFLHESDIFHLDLKLGNIIVKESGELAIIDFAFGYDPLQFGEILEDSYNPKRKKPIIGGSYDYRPPEIPLTYNGLLKKINKVFNELETIIESNDSCDWRGKSYTKQELSLLYNNVIKEICRAYDIWSLGITLLTLILDGPVEGTSLKKNPYTNLKETLTEYASRREKSTKTLFLTNDIYQFLGKKKELFDDNPILQWVLSMLNLDYLNRPTISEITTGFLALFKTQ